MSSAEELVVEALSSVPHRRALVAVSGGRDSVALLHALSLLGHKKLIVVHLDHRLRGRASTGDAKFVARLGGKLGFPVMLGRGDAKAYARDRGLSLEHAARELRHVFFESVARRTRCRTVILAHHADDQVETCLFNFLRGSGIAGLSGMREKSELTVSRHAFTIFRPLLGIRRAKIEAFVAARGIAFREDATNAELAATRNRIRHRVLRAIREEVGDSCEDAIRRAASILAAEDDWMQSEVDRIPRGETLSVAALRSLPLALQRRLIRRWLTDCAITEVGFTEVERVRSLLDVDAGASKVNLPGGNHARRRRGEVFFETRRG